MLTFKFGNPQFPSTHNDPRRIPRPNRAARDTRIRAIFTEYVSNLRSPGNVDVALDAMQIRGGLAQTGYTGYDYAAQRWIEVEF